MARRYSATGATIYITTEDGHRYSGSVVQDDDRWTFDGLYAPAIGFPYSSDDPRAYDRMACSALSFCEYYAESDEHEGGIAEVGSGMGVTRSKNGETVYGKEY